MTSETEYLIEATVSLQKGGVTGMYVEDYCDAEVGMPEHVAHNLELHEIVGGSLCYADDELPCDHPLNHALFVVMGWRDAILSEWVFV